MFSTGGTERTIVRNWLLKKSIIDVFLFFYVMKIMFYTLDDLLVFSLNEQLEYTIISSDCLCNVSHLSPSKGYFLRLFNGLWFLYLQSGMYLLGPVKAFYHPKVFSISYVLLMQDDVLWFQKHWNVSVWGLSQYLWFRDVVLRFIHVILIFLLIQVNGNYGSHVVYIRKFSGYHRLGFWWLRVHQRWTHWRKQPTYRATFFGWWEKIHIPVGLF